MEVLGIMANFLPQKPEKEVISIRIKSETLRIIDNIANQTKISRNELINQCIDFALENFNHGIKKD